MRKILALILGLTMVSVMAFAADYKPGSKIILKNTAAEWGATQPEKILSKDNYSITSQSWTKGKDTIASVAFDEDTEELVITLKNDYTTYKEKALEGSLKIRDKKSSTKVFTATFTGKTVGYDQGTISITDRDYAVLSTAGIDGGTLYKAKANGSSYGTLTLDIENTITVDARVYNDEVFFFGYSMIPDKGILTANEDSDVDVYNFKARPTFSAAATVRFYVEKGMKIYDFQNGKLTRVNATWDEDEGAYVYKTRTLGYYVLSEDVLKNASEGTTGGTSTGNNNESNPDTGANDIVGMATALAVMALVSAAAVSMKKR